MELCLPLSREKAKLWGGGGGGNNIGALSAALQGKGNTRGGGVIFELCLPLSREKATLGGGGGGE